MSRRLVRLTGYGREYPIFYFPVTGPAGNYYVVETNGIGALWTRKKVARPKFHAADGGVERTMRPLLEPDPDTWYLRITITKGTLLGQLGPSVHAVRDRTVKDIGYAPAAVRGIRIDGRAFNANLVAIYLEAVKALTSKADHVELHLRIGNGLTQPLVIQDPQDTWGVVVMPMLWDDKKDGLLPTLAA